MLFNITSPTVGKWSIVINASVCLFVRLSARLHISKTSHAQFGGSPIFSTHATLLLWLGPPLAAGVAISYVLPVFVNYVMLFYNIGQAKVTLIDVVYTQSHSPEDIGGEVAVYNCHVHISQ